MKVLSLFDGISCARVALDRAGLPVEEYLACEIDKHAIKVSQTNYPTIVHLGDVRAVKDVGHIDLLIGGSPCTDLSIAKKGRQGLAGEHSSLFWEYVRLWRETKPTYFLLENVASMPKADKAIITETLGVEPILFDAALVSAQCRKRLFWTNIPQSGLPADRGILLKDILEPNASDWITPSSFTPTPEKAIRGKTKQSFVQVGYVGETNACGVGGQALRVYDAEGKSTTSGVGLYKIGHIGKTDGQANRVYSPEGKSATLSANGGGSGAKTGLYAIGRVELRRLDENGVRHDGDTTYPVVKKITARDIGKSNTLTSMPEHNLVVNTETFSIRKLTPTECERLQGLPDGYTESISKTQRYKCLGNAFNVDVIAHLLSPLRIRN